LIRFLPQLLDISERKRFEGQLRAGPMTAIGVDSVRAEWCSRITTSPESVYTVS